MKIINRIIVALMLVSSTVFVACEETTGGISDITYHVVFDLHGDNLMVLHVGSEYVDPGFIATEKGVDVNSKVKISSDLNLDQPGYYTITYSAVSVDGYSVSITRNVIVIDPTIELSTQDISGEYMVAIARLNTEDGSSESRTIKTPLVITKVADGIFLIPDLLGGWYWYGSDYGESCTSRGYVILTKDNSLSLIQSFPTDFGPESLCVLNEGSKLNDDRTITVKSNMSDTENLIFTSTFTLK